MAFVSSAQIKWREIPALTHEHFAIEMHLGKGFMALRDGVHLQGSEAVYRDCYRKNTEKGFDFLCVCVCQQQP